jgi:hypothetical protein
MLTQSSAVISRGMGSGDAPAPQEVPLGRGKEDTI